MPLGGIRAVIPASSGHAFKRAVQAGIKPGFSRCGLKPQVEAVRQRSVMVALTSKQVPG